jgi:hypothetical protein
MDGIKRRWVAQAGPTPFGQGAAVATARAARGQWWQQVYAAQTKAAAARCAATERAGGRDRVDPLVKKSGNEI